jgi:hypothetical protein
MFWKKKKKKSHEPPTRGERAAAPEPDVDARIEEDLGPDVREELEERAHTGTSVRAEEPDEERTAEYGHTYMGRQMDDRLKGKDRRPRDEDELTE